MTTEHAIRRLAIVMRGSLDVARGSGTAVAVTRLRRALSGAGVNSAVYRVRRYGAPARANASRARAQLAGYDAVLGVDGAGRDFAVDAGLPFVALIKALFAGVLPNERPWVRALLLRSLAIELTGTREADAVVVPSHFAAEAVIRYYGADPRLVHVVPEPFDLDAWGAALPARERTGQRVLCVAHLYPRKRVIDLLDAWPRVRDARPDARLDILGGGPELRTLERRARYLEGCYMHGFVQPHAALEFYARADSFCLPSAQETFGYAVVEAMASGLPVVVADAGALPELVDRAAALLVPPAAAAALADALVRSLESPLRSAAARLNPERTRAFAPSVVVPALLDVVTRAVSEAQRRASGSSALRSGDSRNTSTVARIWSLLAASESAKNPPS